MSIFDQLQNTFSNLDNTPDRSPLSLVAREGLGSRLQAWESPTARRLRAAIQLLSNDRAGEYRGAVESILNQIQSAAVILCQPELLDALSDYPELVEDVEIAGQLLDELCQASRLLRGARDYAAACDAFEIFMEIFAELDAIEDRLADAA